MSLKQEFDAITKFFLLNHLSLLSIKEYRWNIVIYAIMKCVAQSKELDLITEMSLQKNENFESADRCFLQGFDKG